MHETNGRRRRITCHSFTFKFRRGALVAPYHDDEGCPLAVLRRSYADYRYRDVATITSPVWLCCALMSAGSLEWDLLVYAADSWSQASRIRQSTNSFSGHWSWTRSAAGWFDNKLPKERGGRVNSLSIVAINWVRRAVFVVLDRSRDRNGLGQGQRSLWIGAERLLWSAILRNRKNRAVSQEAGNSALRINGGHDAGRFFFFLQLTALPAFVSHVPRRCD